MRNTFSLAAGCVLTVLAGCTGQESTSPTASSNRVAAQSSSTWGPEAPPFNDEIVLRGDGFGLVKFRQPNDADRIVYLDTWVRGLAPNTEYVLQRAVDTTIDDDCTSSAWLTLGKGLTPQVITTDARGTGSEDLYRNLGSVAAGTTFDIHFRVMNVATSAIVLTSGCYQFTVSQ